MTQVKALAIFLVAAFVSPHGSAAESEFSAERRGVIATRLANIVPDARNTYGVSVRRLGEALGVSSAFASMVLKRDDRQLSFAQGVRLANAFHVDVDYVLAADLLDRFGSTSALDSAVIEDRIPTRELLMHLYARRMEGQYGRPNVTRQWSRPEDVLERWRAVMRRRLAGYMPGKDSSAGTPRVHLPQLSAVLGQSVSIVDRKIWGPSFATQDDARLLATTFNVAPDWIYAGDVLDELASSDEVDAAAANEPAALRLMLFRRYADRVLSCRGELL